MSLSVHLRSHVLNGAKLGLVNARAVLALDGSGEPKVVDLQFIIFIKQDIFNFNVTVSDATLVSVLKAFEESLEIEASELLREGTGVGDNVEEVACAGILENDEEYLARLFATFLVETLAIFDLFQDVQMVELLHRDNFGFDD